MPEPACCSEVRRRLIRHGLPAPRVERLVEELSEHWTELRDAAWQEGLSDAEASARADADLGTPAHLTEEAVAALRRSSWLGQHPIVALGVLPLLLTPLLMGVIVLPLWFLDEGIRFSSVEAADATRRAFLITGLLTTIHWTALMAAPLWLCRRLWRAGLGWRWVVAAGLVCLLCALARTFEANPESRNIALGLSFPWRLNLQTAWIVLIHFSVLGAIYLSALPVMRRNSPQPRNAPPSSL